MVEILKLHIECLITAMLEVWFDISVRVYQTFVLRALCFSLLATNKPFSAFNRFNQTKDILLVIRWKITTLKDK